MPPRLQENFPDQGFVAMLHWRSKPQSRAADTQRVRFGHRKEGADAYAGKVTG